MMDIENSPLLDISDGGTPLLPPRIQPYTPELIESSDLDVHPKQVFDIKKLVSGISGSNIFNPPATLTGSTFGVSNSSGFNKVQTLDNLTLKSKIPKNNTILWVLGAILLCGITAFALKKK